MTMRSLLTISILAALGALWPARGHAKLRVVATVPDLAAIAREVGGELVDVQSLSSANQDPHYVDPRPSYVVQLNRADALIAVGMELEIGWLPRLQVQARNPNIGAGGRGFVDASRFVEPREATGGKVDRSQGDVHAEGNPHYLYDPRAGARVARGLAERLAALDAEHAATYRERAARFADELERFAAREAERFRALPPAKRQVVSYHRSLPYMLDWLALTEVAELEPKPGVPPNPSHVAGVLATMRRTGTKVIIQEAHHPTSTSATVAKLAGARLVVITGGTELEAGQTYLGHVERVAKEIYDALAQ